MPKPQHIYRANQVSAEKDLLTVEGSEKVVQYFRQPVRLITMTSLCLATNVRSCIRTVRVSFPFLPSSSHLPFRFQRLIPFGILGRERWMTTLDVSDV